MAYNEPLAARIRARLSASRLPTEEKRMMGGLCFMVRGKMCVGVTGDRLMVRIDPETMAEALARRGCAPMDFTGRPLRSFVFVSPEGWTAPQDFEGWMARALDFNPRAKSSKPLGKKSAPARRAPATRARGKK